MTDAEAVRGGLRGDEAEMFRSFDDELQHRVGRNVRTSPLNIEDACSFAWEQLIRYQPQRDGNWRAWLTTVATREAIRLDTRERRRATLAIGAPTPGKDGVPLDPPDPHDRHVEAVELLEARSALGQLPPRLRRIATLRAIGVRYRDIAEITGDSRQRVGQLATRANQKLAELRNHHELGSESPPRVRLLEDLSRDPPRWLVQAIGRCPGRKRPATHVLAWRRAALAIADYRDTHDMNNPTTALGERPLNPQAAIDYDRALAAINRYRAPDVERGLER